MYKKTSHTPYKQAKGKTVNLRFCGDRIKLPTICKQAKEKMVSAHRSAVIGEDHALAVSWQEKWCEHAVLRASDKITHKLPAAEGEYGVSILFGTCATRLHTPYKQAKGETVSACRSVGIR
jgi:hypothetical protein